MTTDGALARRAGVVGAVALGTGVLLCASLGVARSRAQLQESGGPTASIEQIHVDGPLPDAAARRSLERRLGDFRRCYLRARDLTTRHVRIAIQVPLNGVPAYVQVWVDGVPAHAAALGAMGPLSGCIEQSARTLVFPSHRGDPAALTNIDVRLLLSAPEPTPSRP